MNKEYEYPTDEQLNEIENWDYKLGFMPLIDYIESLWWNPSWGFKLYKGRNHLFKRRVLKLQLHTGGWSGNERIIEALQRNYIFWAICFYKEIVGGHFWFHIRRDHWLPQKVKG